MHEIEEQPQKHPHVRGEDAQAALAAMRKVETPPRAWGRLTHGSRLCHADGNTPTCVGKTVPFRDITVVHQKHPHVRGEDLPIEAE